MQEIISNWGDLISIAQWLLVGLFVLIYFLGGLKKGSKKSLFFFVFNLIAAAISLLLISLFSFRWFVKPDNFYTFIHDLSNRYYSAALVTIENYEPLLRDINIANIILGFVDLALKIVLFFILYPILKFLLRLIIGRPIWKAINKNIIYNEVTKKRILYGNSAPINKKETSRYKKSFLSRLGGGGIGILSGLFAGLIYILPLVILISVVDNIDFEKVNNLPVELVQESETAYLSSGSNLSAPILDSDMLSLIGLVQNVSKKGVSPLYFGLKDSLFNAFFDVNIGFNKKFSLGSELKNINEILNVVIEGNLVDYKNISKEDSGSLNEIFNRLSKSTIFTDLIPAALNASLTPGLISSFLSDPIVGDLTIDDLLNNEKFSSYLKLLSEIDLGEDLTTLYKVVDNLLDYGKLDELLALFEALSNFDLDYLETNGIKIRNLLVGTFEQIKDLKLLLLLNTVISIVPEISEVRNLISWIPEENVKNYLEENLEFIIDDPDFFIGESGEIGNLSRVVSAILGEDCSIFFELISNLNESNTDSLISEKYYLYFNDIVDVILNDKLVENVIPIGIDFGIASLGLEEELNEKVENLVDDVVIKDEVENIMDIYSNITNFAIQALFDGNVGLFVEDLLTTHQKELKDIISIVFDKSALVNNILVNFSGIIVDIAVKDEEINGYLHLLLDDTTVSENIGSDLIKIIDGVILINGEMSISKLVNQKITLKEVLTAISNCDSEIFQEIDYNLTSLNFLNFVDPIVQNMNENGKLDFITDFIEIPKEINYSEFISYALNFSKAIVTEIGTQINYKSIVNMDDLTDRLLFDLNIIELLESGVIESYIYKENSIPIISELIASLVKGDFVQNSLANIPLSIPDKLLDASSNSSIWKKEIDDILGSIFGLVTSVSLEKYVGTSIHDLSSIVLNLNEVNLGIIFELKDNPNVNCLLNTLIVSNTVTNLANKGFSLKLGDSNLKIDVPNSLYNSDGMLDPNEIFATVNNVLGFVDVLIGRDHTIKELGERELSYFVDNFNALNNSQIAILGDNKLLNKVLRFNLEKPSNQVALRGFLSNALNVELSDSALHYTNLTESEITLLLVGLKDLKLNAKVLSFDNDAIVEYINVYFRNTAIDSLFNSNILKQTISQLIYDDGIKTLLVDLVENTFTSALSNFTDLDINYNDLVVNILNRTKDTDGVYFDKEILKETVGLFKSLEVSSLDEFGNFSKFNFLQEKIYNTGFVDALMDFDFTMNIFSDLLKSTKLSSLLTNLVANLLNDSGADISFAEDAINFTNPRYGLFEDGNISKVEFKKFILSLVEINFSNLLSGGFSSIQSISKTLLERSNNEFHQSHIEYMLNSKVLLGIFDIILNTTGREAKYAELINKLGFLPFEVDEEIFVIEKSALENGIIKKSEIYNLINLLSVIDLEGGFGIYTILKLDSNTPNSDPIHYLLSTITLSSIVTNILKSSQLREFGVSKLSSLLEDADPLWLEFPKEAFEEDTKLIKEFEIRQLIRDLKILGFTEDGDVPEIGIDLITDLVGKNYSDGKDDFDRLLASSIIYSVIAKFFQQDALDNKIKDFLSDKLGSSGIDFSNVSIKVPSDLLGTSGVEKDLITKVEIKNLVIAFKALDISRGDELGYGLNLITSLIDINDPSNDEFSKLLNSNYFYILISRAMMSDSISSKINSVVSESFDVTDMKIVFIPSDALGNTGIEDDRIKKSEIRKLFISLTLLGFDEMDNMDFSLTEILNLGNSHKYGEFPEDDLGVLLDSVIVWNLLSFTLTSEETISKFAGDKFSKEEFVLNHYAFDSAVTSRLSRVEIRDLFNSIDVLGIDDFSNIDFDLGIFGTITEEKLDILFTSIYIYTLINCVVNNLDEITLSVDSIDHVSSSRHYQMIDYSEIVALWSAYAIIGDITTFDANSMTLSDFESILDLNSPLIESYISDVMYKNIGESDVLSDYNGNIPRSALVDSIDVKKRIKHIELVKMYDILLLMADGPSSSIFEISSNIQSLFDGISLNLLGDIINVESIIVDAMISQSILYDESIGLYVYRDLAEFREAYDLDTKLVIKHYVLANFIANVEGLFGSSSLSLSESFSQDTFLTLNSTLLQNNIGNSGELMNSLFTKALIESSSGGDSFITSLPTLSMDNIPTTKAGSNFLLIGEISSVFDILTILEADGESFDVLEEKILNSPATLINKFVILAERSPLVRRIISKGIIDTGITAHNEFAYINEGNLRLGFDPNYYDISDPDPKNHKADLFIDELWGIADFMSNFDVGLGDLSTTIQNDFDSFFAILPSLVHTRSKTIVVNYLLILAMAQYPFLSFMYDRGTEHPVNFIRKLAMVSLPELNRTNDFVEYLNDTDELIVVDSTYDMSQFDGGNGVDIFGSLIIVSDPLSNEKTVTTTVEEVSGITSIYLSFRSLFLNNIISSGGGLLGDYESGVIYISLNYSGTNHPIVIFNLENGNTVVVIDSASLPSTGSFEIVITYEGLPIIGTSNYSNSCLLSNLVLNY
ncbi:MAG: hypothetical protein LBV58_00340 [Acholeplasmatales bacterium]|jgi:hypothetical protein|nr:hypothetical protein [Acholeplasmatales bacterium]